MRRALLVALVACRTAPPAAPPGSSQDEGGGELAQASTKLMTAERSEQDPFAPRPAKHDPAALGGTTYGNYVVPPWQPPPGIHRTTPMHQQQPNLGGAIEGVVTWRGALPGKRQTPCGPEAVVAVGADRGLAGVVVLIERVKVGRAMPIDGHVAQVGGVVVKRGCALRPTAQLVTPLPAALTIHGDAHPTRLRVTPPNRAGRMIALQEGGREAVPVELGVTRVESDDGSLAAAFVLATDAPYYAVTDDRGRFRIDELASGTYELTFWHPPLPREGAGPPSYGEPLIAKRTVTVAGIKPARLDVALGR